MSGSKITKVSKCLVFNILAIFASRVGMFIPNDHNVPRVKLGWLGRTPVGTYLYFSAFLGNF